MSEVKEGKRFTGNVVWFNSKRGIGFIKPDDQDKDLFVHYSNIQMEGFKTLSAGQRVEFKIGSNEKGPMAVEVTIK